ncbi:MAG: D-alanyl-D-alanine carboxypeptidase/D-alanyl-D-alanine-endopeptidase [Saprospiraceae bacterium]
MRHFLFLLFLSTLSSSLFAQSRIQSAINTFAKGESVKNASVGVCVIDVNSGQIVASHQPNQSLIPASALKAMTTATALANLGGTYRFKTELQHDGTISNGVLNGNLYLEGYGDPTFASDQLEETTDLAATMQELVECLNAASVKQINGKIIGDASYFATQITPGTWQWNDMGNYYGIGAAGLNVHENLYYLNFQQNQRLGQTVKVASTSPEVPDLEIISEVTSAGARTGDNAYIYGTPYSNLRYVRGTIPVGSGLFDIKGSMPDPAKFGAYHLQQTLQQNGIAVSNSYTTVRELQQNGESVNTNRTKLFTHYSPELKDIIKRTNIKSVNLYCEAMLKTIGAVKGGEGSTEKGLEIMLDFWEQRGLNTDGLYLDDGSGLSRTNVITTFQLAKILQLAARDSGIYTDLYNSLPVGSESGSLKNMFRGTAAAGNIRAKSGTIKRVRSFTGYATTKAGQQLAFCIIANNFSGSGGAMRRKMEKVMTTFCN